MVFCAVVFANLGGARRKAYIANSDYFCYKAAWLSSGSTQKGHSYFAFAAKAKSFRRGAQAIFVHSASCACLHA